MQTRSTCGDAPLKFGEMLNSDQSDNEQVHDYISSINQPSQLGVRVKASQVRAQEYEGVAVGPDTSHDIGMQLVIWEEFQDLALRSRPKMSILPTPLTNRTEPILERSKIDKTLHHSNFAISS